jgi:hypothetical protein
MQADDTPLRDAEAAVGNRYAVWSAYHEFCYAVAKWTTTPLLDSKNEGTLKIDDVRATVDSFTAKAFQLSKANQVRCKASVHRPARALAPALR